MNEPTANLESRTRQSGGRLPQQNAPENYASPYSPQPEVSVEQTYAGRRQAAVERIAVLRKRHAALEKAVADPTQHYRRPINEVGLDALRAAMKTESERLRRYST